MAADPDRTRDELLAVRCQLGEAAAFDELIERWHGPLWGYVRRVLGADQAAADVLQDVWVRVIRGLPRLRDASSLRPWLFGIARRAVIDRLREKYDRPAESGIGLLDVAADEPDDDLECDMEALDRALERLPVVERDVLTLFYLASLSLNEVAAALAVPVGTVKSRLFRARSLLRSEMTKEGRR